MYIPETWERRQFNEWNLLVEGLMEAWGYAEALGSEECLLWHLNIDASGQLAELLSFMGRHLVSALRPVSGRQQGRGKRNNGHSPGDDEVEAYIQSAGSAELPTEQAYAGAKLVREFLLQVEQFAEEKELSNSDLQHILCEAMCIYADRNALPHTLPLSS